MTLVCDPLLAATWKRGKTINYYGSQTPPQSPRGAYAAIGDRKD